LGVPPYLRRFKGGLQTGVAQNQVSSMKESSSNIPYGDRAMALRHDPMVEAWINEFRTAFDWSPKYPDCMHCSYPHAPMLLCYGAQFGQTRIGYDLYSIDFSNVCWFVEFRRKQRQGFHWRRDIYFRRTDDGGVEVTSYTPYNNSPQEHIWKILATEWASIVCNVSAIGETGERWNAAQDFHGSAEPSAGPSP
jgi:hypothetical protein